MSFRLEALELRRFLAVGQLDTSFGNAGVFVDTAVTVPDGVESNGSVVAGNPVDRVLVQPDGKILIAGHGNGSVLLERYTPAGAPDTTLNGTGHESIPLGADVSAAVND